MKIIYLLPPSEGKNAWWELWTEKLSFAFKKPFEIAINATEKDLKCREKRYEEGIELNKNLGISQKLIAIERYSWVMYSAIDYNGMTQSWKQYFENNFLILSGMYGIVRPLDMIWNYKLPIETKWLYSFWWDQITHALNDSKADYIIDMLPWSYAKMIQWKDIDTQIIRINFLHKKDWELKKITHWVKKVKGEYIKNICENWEGVLWEKVQISENKYHVNIIS